ncbi:MAG: MGMT family protein [Verrucomicrobiales bacterium]|jgi:methylated-DNA-[protein]-cysteine S-methyltransferase|nr:MGMT family protein [Verrucomicrobiales bacterium]
MSTLERPPTEFERKVYDAVQLVPKGMVTTYGLLGQYIACASAQAIGQALRRNPFAPETPCHRVVSRDLSIGGFYGTSEGEPIERKRRLLEREGVTFLENGLIDPKCCYEFDE